MTAAQSFIRTDLNDAQRVARLRAAAVLEEERTCRTVWTMPDGSRVERGCAGGVAAYGTLPSERDLIERTIQADRQTVAYYRTCERSARRAYRGTGMESWRAAAEQWVLARFRLEADIRAHLRELIRIRRGTRKVTVEAVLSRKLATASPLPHAGAPRQAPHGNGRAFPPASPLPGAQEDS